MPTPLRIPAPAEGGLALPPCAGSWRREPDGALVPADESTAMAAALLNGIEPTERDHDHPDGGAQAATVTLEE